MYGGSVFEKRDRSNALALSIYYSGRNDRALFLRRPQPDAEDNAVFDLPVVHSVSLAQNGKRVAFAGFTEERGGDPHPWGLGILNVGEQSPTLIDWPRWELTY